jgi:hypothetical protein
MVNPARSRAEEKFTASQKKDRRALDVRELARQERAKKIANLRALRLAKEATEGAAAAGAAEKTAAKK